MYRSVAAAFEGAVGVGFDVRRAYRLEDGGVEQDRWCEVPHNAQSPVYRCEALGPYQPELRVRGLVETCT